MQTPIPNWQIRLFSSLFLLFIGWMWYQHSGFTAIRHGLMTPFLGNNNAWFWGQHQKAWEHNVNATTTPLTHVRSLYNLANWEWFGRGHGVAVPGEDGWVFYQDEIKPINKEYENGEPYISMLEKLNRLCEARGFKLYILPVLPKTVVHAAQLPGGLKDYPGVRERERRYLSVIEAFEEKGILTIPWPHEDFDDYHSDGSTDPFFEKVDTHWNSEGADFAAQAVVLRLNKDFDIPDHKLKFHVDKATEISDMIRRLKIPAFRLEEAYTFQHQTVEIVSRVPRIPAGYLVGTSYSANYDVAARISEGTKGHFADHSTQGAPIAMVIHAALSLIEMNRNESRIAPIVLEFPTRLLDLTDEWESTDRLLDRSLAVVDQPLKGSYNLNLAPIHQLTREGRFWLPDPSGGYFEIDAEAAEVMADSEFFEFNIKIDKWYAPRDAKVKVVWMNEELGPFWEENGPFNISREWQVWRFPIVQGGHRATKLRIYPATKDWRCQISRVRFR